MDYGGLAYNLVKSAHIVAMVAWMAGMFYLPRLFVYHAEAPAGSPQSETFKVMERRLLRAIMGPAMVATWLLGLLLAWEAGLFAAHWLHAKLTLVILLSGLHGFLAKTVKDFAADRNKRSARFYRIINEVPTLALILIVVLVVVKPF
jgi:protoporphyrinogen IX oxidase